MYAEERQEKLLAILKELRKLSVGEMSERFGVSGATIRTDLRILEDAGMLTRTHGGAILRTRASFELGSDQREGINLPAKEQIGRLAASLVQDGDIIVLDTGTTTLHIARYIRQRRNLTVITNDFMIAKNLEEAESIQIVLLGGIVKAFMGVNALSLKQGACVADIMLAETKRSMVEHANQVIVVCDHSKLDNTSLAQFAAPEQIDTVVVDRLPGNAPEYREAGITLLSVETTD
jgi:DeoR family fructose operon transcriptional repressor